MKQGKRGKRGGRVGGNGSHIDRTYEPPPHHFHHQVTHHHHSMGLGIGGPVGMSSKPEPPVIELENQFILRLPSEPAVALREALRAGASNIKERLLIQLEPDKASSNTSYLRKGFVEFDGWNMHAKLMDLPTVVGSYKTIDKKNFYKTADVCQILICKEGEPSDDDDETAGGDNVNSKNDEDEDSNTNKQKSNKKDPHKADKKYRYPHGICNPLKNCRKRRFRKTLKKRFVEAPEIEKEVKRLLRVDNEAVDVKWDLVTEEELNLSKAAGGMKNNNSADSVDVTSNQPSANLSSLDNLGGASSEMIKGDDDDDEKGVREQDLFGALSDSDDDRPNADVDIDSEGDSNTFDNAKFGKGQEVSGPTSFSGLVLPPPPPSAYQETPIEDGKDSAVKTGGGIVAQKLEKLRIEINQLKQRKGELESNIAHCDNQVLQQRFQESLNEVIKELDTKTMESESMSMMFS